MKKKILLHAFLLLGFLLLSCGKKKEGTDFFVLCEGKKHTPEEAFSIFSRVFFLQKTRVANLNINI